MRSGVTVTTARCNVDAAPFSALYRISRRSQGPHMSIARQAVNDEFGSRGRLEPVQTSALVAENAKSPTDPD